jgi:DNA repair exonuclease SbcCD nuclease subunit
MLPSGRNSRLQDTLNILEQINKIADEEGADGILFGGDMFHIRPGTGSMKIPTFNAVFDAIAKLKMGRDFVGLLVGNHDQGNKAGTEHSIYAFGSIATVMDQRQWYTFEGGQQYLHVFAVPACSDRSTVTSDIDAGVRQGNVQFEKDGAPRIMLGHLGIDGGEVGSNFVLRDDHLNRVHELQHGAFHQVFLGDYHKPQKLADNVQYIGATHHHNWSDEGQLRGCLIWDSDSEKLEFHHLYAPTFTKCPIDEWEDLDLDWCHDGFVRITYDYMIPQVKQDEITERLLSAGIRNVEFFPNPTSGKKDVDTGSVFNPSMDQESMVEAYVNAEQSEDLDEDLLLHVGRDIFARAMNRSGQ